MSVNKKEALELAKRVEGYINSDTLTENEKETIVSEAAAAYDENINSGWIPYRDEMSVDKLFTEWSHQGDKFSDIKGNEFIDCLGGFGIFLTGHRNEEIIRTVHAQLDRYAQHSQDVINPLQAYFSRLMAMITPGDLQVVWPTNGGTEVTEAAIKLSKLATGGKWFISTVNAYHGLSTGAVALIGCADYRAPFTPLYPYVQHVKYGDAQQLENAIENLEAVGEKIAGFICEPIQGEGGFVIPPEGYLKRVRELCDEHGIAMIVDEIQTGFGRAGSLFRCEAEGVTPDIMTFGKAVGGGCVPLTGMIARPWMVTDELIENPTLVSMPTFGGNPLAMAAGIASIRYILENDIPGTVKAKGEYFMGKLEKIREAHPDVIKELRGTGLMLGLVFEDMDTSHLVIKKLSARKIMSSAAMNLPEMIRLEPPANITEESMDKVCAALEEIAAELEK